MFEVIAIIAVVIVIAIAVVLILAAEEAGYFPRPARGHHQGAGGADLLADQ